MSINPDTSLNKLFKQYRQSNEWGVSVNFSTLDDSKVYNLFDKNDHEIVLQQLEEYKKKINLEPSNDYTEYINQILDLEIKMHNHPLNKFYLICPFNDLISLYLENIKTHKLKIGKDIKYETLYTHLNKFIAMYENFSNNILSTPSNQIQFSKNIAKSSSKSLKDFLKGKGYVIPKEQFINPKDYTRYRKEIQINISKVLRNMIKILNKIKSTPNISDLAFKDSKSFYPLSFSYQNPGIKFEPLKQVKQALKQIISLLIVGEYYAKRKLQSNSNSSSNSNSNSNPKIEINDMSLENYLTHMELTESNPKHEELYKLVDTIETPEDIVESIDILMDTKQIKRGMKILRKIMFHENNKFTSIIELVDSNNDLDKKIVNLFAKNIKLNFPPKKNMRIEIVPKYNQKFAPSAYYENLRLKEKSQFQYDIIQHGAYYINPALQDTFRKNEVKTLFLHEAYPGHHLERDTVLLNPKVPLEIKYCPANNAYVEGWATYVEDFTLDINPTMEEIIGKINYDLFRTVRIVLDIGINYYQIFDTKQSKNIMKKLTLMDKQDIDYEVIRYASIPGQATTYMLGKWEIQRIINKYIINNKMKSSSETNKDVLKDFLEIGPISLQQIDKILENKYK